jgi:hypothetical protein
MSLLRDNVDIVQKNKEPLIVASKKVDVEVKADKTKSVSVSLSECGAKPCSKCN